MNPLVAQLILIGVETLVKEAPGVVAVLQGLFADGNPTPEKFAAARAKLQADTYDVAVPSAAKFESALAGGEAAQS